MSDAAIMSMVSGAITIVTIVVGFLTLWVRLKYAEADLKLGQSRATDAVSAAKDAVSAAKERVDSIEQKIDDNTTITTAAADAAKAAERQTNGAMDAFKTQVLDHQKRILEQQTRIAELEKQLAVLKVAVDGVEGNITKTRHEVRGHFQSVVNKLDLMAMANGGRFPQQQSSQEQRGREETK